MGGCQGALFTWLPGQIGSRPAWNMRSGGVARGITSSKGLVRLVPMHGVC